MNALVQSLSVIIGALYLVYLFTIMVRFSIVSQKIALFNPIYNAFYALTDKPVSLLKKILPKSKIDWSSLIYAYLVSLVVVTLLSFLGNVFSLYIFLWAFILLLSGIKSLMVFGIFIVILMSWIAPQKESGNQNPAVEVLNASLAPVLGVFRRFIPTIGGLDISPIFLLLFLTLFEIIVINQLKLLFMYPMALVLI